jgi:hypothetical protein
VQFCSKNCAFSFYLEKAQAPKLFSSNIVFCSEDKERLCSIEFNQVDILVFFQALVGEFMYCSLTKATTLWKRGIA